MRLFCRDEHGSRQSLSSSVNLLIIFLNHLLISQSARSHQTAVEDIFFVNFFFFFCRFVRRTARICSILLCEKRKKAVNPEGAGRHEFRISLLVTDLSDKLTATTVVNFVET